MTIFVPDQNLAKCFNRHGRHGGMLTIFSKRFPKYGFWKGGGPTGAITDITVGQDTSRIVEVPHANYVYALDEDSMDMKVSNFITEFQEGITKPHYGNTPQFLNMQTESLALGASTEAMHLEYFPLVNNTHLSGENMDRITTNQEQSFIPVDIGKSYLNEVIAYYKKIFGRLPKEYYAIDYNDKDRKLNLKKSIDNIEKNFTILNQFIYRAPDKHEKTVLSEINFVLDGGILVFLSDPFNAAIVVYDNVDQLDTVLANIVATKKRKTPEKPKFKLLVHSAYGFGLEEFDLKHFDVNVHDNYNDDLPDKKIRDFINSESEAGLCILHGKPGTGKTYYIRDLIRSCKREFIYMNKECLQYINDSSFIAFLIKSKNSVFIMEDCENVLVDRAQYNNTISTLLNLSDGLLGDSLNNKFICTFNTDITNIDKALLRKGRMKVCYEFKYLSADKANALAAKLNRAATFDKDVPLCEVMNAESNGNEAIPEATKKIGF